MGIYELLIADDAVGALILANADAQTIKRTAQAEGMDSLRDDGARKVMLGKTTVEEVDRGHARTTWSSTPGG